MLIDIVMEVIVAFGVISEQQLCLDYLFVLILLYALSEKFLLTCMASQHRSLKYVQKHLLLIGLHHLQILPLLCLSRRLKGPHFLL